MSLAEGIAKKLMDAAIDGNQEDADRLSDQLLAERKDLNSVDRVSQ